MNTQRTFEKLLKEKWKIIKETNKETVDKFGGELNISSVNKSVNETIKYINSREKELNKEENEQIKTALKQNYEKILQEFNKQPT